MVKHGSKRDMLHIIFRLDSVAFVGSVWCYRRMRNSNLSCPGLGTSQKQQEEQMWFKEEKADTQWPFCLD